MQERLTAKVHKETFVVVENILYPDCVGGHTSVSVVLVQYLLEFAQVHVH